jgi:hypothetical protein
LLVSYHWLSADAVMGVAAKRDATTRVNAMSFMVHLNSNAASSASTLM